MDGFRAVAYVEGGACRLVSRNRNAFKTFEALAQAIAQYLSGRAAILDGELPFLRRRGVRARRSIEAAVWQIDRNVDTPIALVPLRRKHRQPRPPCDTISLPGYRFSANRSARSRTSRPD
jgi:hypothetical protein